MKKLVALIFALLNLQLGLIAQVSLPGKPAFMVTYEEQGKNGMGSWQIIAVQKFSVSFFGSESLASNNYGTDYRTIPVELKPGAVSGLKSGLKIMFYPSSINDIGTGFGGSFTRVLSSGGVDRITVKTAQGTYTEMVTDDDYRRENGIPYNQNYRLNARYYALDGLAELTRTANGATLYANIDAMADPLEGWGVSDDLYSSILTDVRTFKFTNKELEDWTQITKTNEKSAQYDDESITIKITVTMDIKDEKVDLKLSGCTELGVSEQGQITAEASVEGGSYRFWTEPEGLLSIEQRGASATLKGSSPGKGSIMVEYASPEGKIITASKVAACIKVESYNNRTPVPKIILFDINGYRLLENLKIPVNILPIESADLLEFIPADPGTITTVGVGDMVMLQPLREGKTTFQATTQCGGTTGPVVNIDIAWCDDETKAKLSEMMRIAKNSQKEQAEEIERIMGSKDFERASGRIAESTMNLALKTGQLIIGTLSGGAGASVAAKTASDIISKGSLLIDVVSGGDVLTQTKNVASVAVELSGNTLIQATAGTIETVDAATKFGEDLGALLAANQRLAEAVKWYNHWTRQVEDISYRQSICRKGYGENPAPKRAESSQTNQSMENPQMDQGQVGLPYQPSDCGCNNTQGLSASEESLFAMQAGMEHLGTCVDNFTNGPLAEYMKTLQDWAGVTEILKKAAISGGKEFEEASKKSVPILESLILRTKSFDEAGKTFFKEFEACPKSMENSIGILQSAKTIPVKSLTENNLTPEK